MSTKSHIEWTDDTWNPVAGCTAVSPGCANCYAARITRRLGRMPATAKDYGGLAGERHFNGVVRCLPHKLDIPLGWKKPRRIFVNSMSDLFHEAVPFGFIDRVFAVMAQCPRHVFQVLTKRPDRMAEYLNDDDRSARLLNAGMVSVSHWTDLIWPLPNVWLGTSVENQAAADLRIPHLLRCPAAVRFLSCEPLLSPLVLDEMGLPPEYDADCCPDCGGSVGCNPDGSWVCIAVHGVEMGCGWIGENPAAAPRVDWLIAGGESGLGSRPCNFDWLRSLRDQCQAAEVPIFIKQLGANPHGMWEHGDPPKYHLTHQNGRSEVCEARCKNGRWKLTDRAGRWMDEWPEDLRIREYPTTEGTAACSAS